MSSTSVVGTSGSESGSEEGRGGSVQSGEERCAGETSGVAGVVIDPPGRKTFTPDTVDGINDATWLK